MLSLAIIRFEWAPLNRGVEGMFGDFQARFSCRGERVATLWLEYVPLKPAGWVNTRSTPPHCLKVNSAAMAVRERQPIKSYGDERASEGVGKGWTNRLAAAFLLDKCWDERAGGSELEKLLKREIGDEANGK